jgi:hypothetical protein
MKGYGASIWDGKTVLGVVVKTGMFLAVNIAGVVGISLFLTFATMMLKFFVN